MSDNNESPVEAPAATTVSDEKDKLSPEKDSRVREEGGDVSASIATRTEAQTISVHPKTENTEKSKEVPLLSVDEDVAPRTSGTLTQKLKTVLDGSSEAAEGSMVSHQVVPKHKQPGSSQQSASDSLLPESNIEKVIPPPRLSISCHERNLRDERRNLLLAARYFEIENSRRMKALTTKDPMSHDHFEMRRKKFVPGRRHEAMKMMSDLKRILTDVSASKSMYIPPRYNQQSGSNALSRKKWDTSKVSSADDNLKSRDVLSVTGNNQSEGHDERKDRRCVEQRKLSEFSTRRDRKRWEIGSSSKTDNVPTVKRKRSRNRLESRNLETKKKESKSDGTVKKIESTSQTAQLSDPVTENGTSVTNPPEELPSEDVHFDHPDSYCPENDLSPIKDDNESVSHKYDEPFSPPVEIQKVPRKEVTPAKKTFRLFIRVCEVQQKLQEISKAARNIIDITELLSDAFSLLNCDFSEQPPLRRHFSESELRRFEEFQEEFDQKTREEYSATASGDSHLRNFADVVPMSRSLSETRLNLRSRSDTSVGGNLIKKNNVDVIDRSLSREQEIPMDKNCDSSEVSVKSCCLRDNKNGLPKAKDCTAKELTSSTNIPAGASTSSQHIIVNEDSKKEGTKMSFLRREELKKALINDSGDYRSGENVVIIDDVVGKNDCFERCEAANVNHTSTKDTKSCGAQTNQSTVGEGGDVPSFSSEESEEPPHKSNVSPPAVTDTCLETSSENLNFNERQQVSLSDKQEKSRDSKDSDEQIEGEEACLDTVEGQLDLTPSSSSDNKSEASSESCGSSEFIVANQNHFLIVSVTDTENVNIANEDAGNQLISRGTQMVNYKKIINDSPEQVKAQDNCPSKKNKSMGCDKTETPVRLENKDDNDGHSDKTE